jgi:peptidoglycan/LPS O-acetylase OafA/YrhL
MNHRLKILDGFRTISILAVILYHYFSRWIFEGGSSLYPYKGQYDYFKYGYLGVRFFFVISGFVIFFTLEHTENFRIFWIKRIIRLLPTMVIVSLITYICFRLFDKDVIFPASHSARNILPSVTFINPEAFNLLFRKSDVRFDYLNGSFWSLWPEIQFYFLSSVLYFCNRKKFIRNYLISFIVIISAFWFFRNVQASNSFHVSLPRSIINAYNYWFETLFNLPVYIVYFTLGVLFYVLYKNNLLRIKVPPVLWICLLMLISVFLYFGVQWQVRLIYFGILLLFFCFIYFPKALFFLEARIVTEIGVASYTIYLLHENIGVLLIHLYAARFSPVEFFFPVIIMVVIFLISIIYTRTLDTNMSAYFKNAFLSNGRAKVNEAAANPMKA